MLTNNNTQSAGNRTSFIIFLFTISALVWFKFTFHELWKDEWQAWFVSKDKNFIETLQFLNYEGHPALWYLFIKPFTFFSLVALPENILTAAHTILVVASFYILYQLFRLPLVFKLLFSFSYFLSFEYGIVNRGYILVVLLAFIISWLLKTKTKPSWVLGLSLLMLCQTEVYGALMAIAFGLFIYLDSDQLPRMYKAHGIQGIIAGLFLFIVSVSPRSSGHIARTKGKDLSFIDSILTSFQGNLSNTYLLGSTPDTFTYGWNLLGLSLSCVTALGIIFILRKHRPALITMLFFILMMIAFGSIIFLGGVRQWGMGFIFLIAIIHLNGIDVFKEKIESGLLALFCFFSLFHGARAFNADYTIPFTNAKEAGHFIRDKVPEKVPVVALNKFETTPVLGYAGRSFYELPSGEPFTYFRWVDRIYVPTQQELMLFSKFKGVGGIIIISPKPIDQERFPNAQLWTSFTKENYKKENYYLYSLKRETVQ